MYRVTVYQCVSTGVHPSTYPVVLVRCDEKVPRWVQGQGTQITGQRDQTNDSVICAVLQVAETAIIA